MWDSLTQRVNNRVNIENNNLTSPALVFSLLGSFSAELDGAVLAFPRSRKTRALLAYLVCHEKPQNRSKLAELFFTSAADPGGSLRWSLSRLNSILPADVLVANREQVRVSSSMFTTDLGKLESVAASQNKANICDYFSSGYPIEGEFLPDLVFDDLPEFETWRITTQARYERLKIQAMTRFLELAPESPHKIAIAEQLVALDNHNERSWCYLVEYLEAEGNHREADKVLQMARRQLAKNNVQPLGLLGKTFSREAQAQTKTNQRQSGGRAPFSRATLAVSPCVDPIEKHESILLHKVTAALFAAASCIKTCAALSFGEGVDLNDASGNRPDYVLESRLIRDGNDGELSVDFVEVSTRACLFSWRERLPEIDTFDVTGFVTGYFSNRFELDLQLALVGQAMTKPEAELSAQELYYVATSYIHGAEGYNYDKALTLLDKALLMDSGLGCALAASAWVRAAHPDFNLRAEDRALTVSLARRAVDLSRDDCFVLAWSTLTIAHIEGDLHTGMDIVARALSFNAHSTLALIAAGLMSNLLGDDDASVEYLDRAERWGDTEPLTFIIYYGRASVAYQQEQYDEALLWSQKSAGRNPKFAPAIRLLAASQCRLGMMAQAKKSAVALHEVDSNETVDFFWNIAAYHNRDTVERICADLRKSGLPEV